MQSISILAIFSHPHFLMGSCHLSITLLQKKIIMIVGLTMTLVCLCVLKIIPKSFKVLFTVLLHVGTSVTYTYSVRVLVHKLT